jgi:hypothetical protein
MGPLQRDVRRAVIIGGSVLSTPEIGKHLAPRCRRRAESLVHYSVDEP